MSGLGSFWPIVASACVAFIASPAPAQVGFGPPAVLNTNAAIDVADDGGPRIATDGLGRWVAVWASDDPLDGTLDFDFDLFVARSTDRGRSWSDPAALNTNAASDAGNDVAPRISHGAQGRWLAVWASAENLGGALGSDFDILVARSTDGAVSWSPPAPLALDAAAAPPAGAVKRDFGPRLATDGMGNWIVSWSRAFQPAGDSFNVTRFEILAARSTDGGATWSPPLLLDAAVDTNVADARPFGARIATGGAGHWIATWPTVRGASGGADVVIARSDDVGATWTLPAPIDPGASAFAGDARDPSVATDGAGRWVAVWASTRDRSGALGSDLDILTARSTDGGATWSAPAPLNSNANADAGADLDPEIRTDGSGTWIALWGSTDTLAGTIGSDDDLLFAVSTDAGETWTPPTALNADAAKDERGDFTPDAATDGSGFWMAVWASAHTLGLPIGFDTDIFLATSPAPAAARYWHGYASGRPGFGRGPTDRAPRFLRRR